MSLEFDAVRDPTVEYLKALGWKYLQPDECLELRGTLSESFLLPVVKQRTRELNPGVIETDEQAEDVIKKLRNTRTTLEGNQEFLQHLRGEKTFYLESEGRELNIQLIDFDNPDNNDYHVTKEFEFSDIKTDRADVILFVNGIPILIVEAKSPTKEDAIQDAYAQIRRYHDEIPELLKAVQLYAVTEGIQLKFGPTWNLDQRNLHDWRVGERADLESLTKDFFDRGRVLRILEDYIVFFTMDEELYKFVLDQHQMRGVEKVVRRVIHENLDSGLIWHTQGSGKSLTMIVAAHRLRNQESLENPTTLVVVDRKGLERQMSGNLAGYGFPSTEVAMSKNHLQKLLKSDFRGLIVTTVQKFEGIEKNANTRKNVIVLIDEAHRSQEGHLGNYMRGALPNARYFGFTGTPIDKGSVGKGTFVVFGKHDPDGYLDKYSIQESIKDGTTVPLYYTLAPQKLRVNKELLEEEFFRLVEEEGIASIEALDKMLAKAVQLKNFLKSRDRIGGIARHIAGHFKESVEPMGLKAFIVAVDREGCALYKEAIDRYLPQEYSAVVFTQDQRDSALLRQFHISDDKEENIKRSFKAADKLPKILIVTQKLLTGFDAPVLYCMYLDKPFKDHTLLQAIARVNRPIVDEEGQIKSSGLIVDFVGVLENLKRALTFDSATVEGALTDLSVLKDKFAELMSEAGDYLALVEGGINDKTVAAISDGFFDPEKRQQFFNLFRQIQEIYEILSPDVFLRDYIEPYKSLTQLFKIVQNIFRPKEADLYKDLRKKTSALIKEHTTLESIVKGLPVYEIDDKTVDRLQRSKVPRKAKVVNLYRSIIFHVQRVRRDEPHLYSLGERAEAIIQRLQKRQLDSRRALEDLGDIVKNIAQSEAERTKLGLTKHEFSIFWSLQENQVSNDAVKLSKDLQKLLEDSKTWPVNRKAEMAVRREIYKMLLGKLEADRLTSVVNSILDMHRRMMAP